MGQAYGRLGNTDKAIELLNEVKQKNPTGIVLLEGGCRWIHWLIITIGIDELVKQELTRIKQEEKKGQEQVKSTYWGMFDRKSSSSSSKQAKA